MKNYRKVLIVENAETVRKEICDILRMENFKVSSAVNGFEGLIKTRNEKPDLIISDIIMPVLNGYQFIKRIKKDPLTENIPVIFLSAKSKSEDIFLGMNLGVDEYLSKPILADDLINAINHNFEKPAGTNKREFRNLTEKPFTNRLIGLSDVPIMESPNNLPEKGIKTNIKIEDSLNNSKTSRTFSSISSNKKKSKNTEIKVHLILQQLMIQELRATGRIKDVKLIMQNFSVNFEEFYFKKIVKNLIRNAMLFSHKGDDIILTSKLENEKLVLEMENKGFWKYLKQKSKLVNKVKDEQSAPVGSTIGLSVIESITRLFGGEFKINSNPDKHYSVYVAINLVNKKYI